MTKLLDTALEAVSALPDDKQDELAELVLKFISLGETIHQLTPEEEASFAKSLDQAAKREFASDDEVRQIFSKYAT
jgi:hypothetical protein